ncbi:hypothetical protein [Paenibacillus gansuensis]|uniref:Uncharacterized protein n=1 Tax=Paenibacillus gansuensis TaxID=306542 RepID=A0ABW5PDN1_9BACL
MKPNRKIKKHITIKINYQTVKILKYKEETHQDNFTGETYGTIELITKIDNEVFHNKTVTIELENKNVIYAKWITRFSQPGLLRYKYRIQSEAKSLN